MDGFEPMTKSNRLPSDDISPNPKTEAYLCTSPSEVRKRLQGCSKPLSSEVVQRRIFNRNGCKFERQAADEVWRQHSAEDGDGTPVKDLIPHAISGLKPLVLYSFAPTEREQSLLEQAAAERTADAQRAAAAQKEAEVATAARAQQQAAAKAATCAQQAAAEAAAVQERAAKRARQTTLSSR
jgi:hypothetical protein